jgi:hypothetical protein
MVSLVGPSVLLARLRLVAGASLGALDPGTQTSEFRSF